jgi:hypothetical protein
MELNSSNLAPFRLNTPTHTHMHARSAQISNKLKIHCWRVILTTHPSRVLPKSLYNSRCLSECSLLTYVHRHDSFFSYPLLLLLRRNFFVGDL